MDHNNGSPQEETSNKLVGGNPKPNHLFTRKMIPDVFRTRRDLTTIQIQDTVLHRDSDDDKGAGTFVELIKKLTARMGPNLSYFEMKWLVSDPRQLKYAIQQTKKRAPGAFGTLTSYATVAIVEPSSDFYRVLRRILFRYESEGHKIVTAFYSEQDKKYQCYGHFVPPTDQDWDNGSLCMSLDNASSELDDILQKLHHAHVEKLSGHEGNQVKGFENSGISIFSLEELIKQA